MNNSILLFIVKLIPFLTFLFTFWVSYTTGIILNFEYSQSVLLFIVLSFEIYINWAAIVVANYSNFSIFLPKPRTNSKYNQFNFNADRRTDDSILIHLEETLDIGKECNNRDSGFLGDNSIVQDFTLLTSLNPSVNIQKIWYCPKCKLNTSQNCHHCPLCDRCYILRDHHCFFLGACINKDNLAHFIVICLYTSVTTFFVLTLLGPYMSTCFQSNGPLGFWSLRARYFFPVALGHWLSGHLSHHVLSLVVMYDLCVTVTLSTTCFGLYYLCMSCTGTLQYRLSRCSERRLRVIRMTNVYNNFTFIFGHWGLVNFVFPLSLGRRCLSFKYLQFIHNEYKFQ